MKSIDEIKSEIKKLKELAIIHQEKLDANPSAMTSKLTLRSINNQIDELVSQLSKENEDRHKEIIELRFKGRKAEYGSMPLYTIGALTDSFYQALFNISKHVQYGAKKEKNGNKIIRDTIDLRLEDIGKGSTIFYISGRTSPDLFGNSIIQLALDNTMSFLNSDEKELAGNMSGIGTASIRHFNKLFKELNEDGLELDIKWQTPEDTTHVWNGTTEKILSLSNTLSKIRIKESIQKTITGEIESLYLKGKMEIRDEEKNKYAVGFPINVREDIKTLHVGDYVTIDVMTTTVLNESTGKERHEYALVSILSST